MTDEELIARLRDACFLAFDDGTNDYSSAPDAADRIEALVERLTAAGRDAHEAEALANEALSRVERLEAAASSVADDVCSYICPSVGRAGEPILHDPRCTALRAALKGADHE